MYSTYLVDSVRPHLSAKRLISGAALNNISGTMNYNQTSILPNQYNNFSQRSNIQNTQPVNSMPNTNVANLGYNSSFYNANSDSNSNYSSNNINYTNSRFHLNNTNSNTNTNTSSKPFNMMNPYSSN